MNSVYLQRAAASAAMVLAVLPSSARADGTTEVGLVAGAGLAAASGKTTVANGGGGVEAALLASDAFLKAGAIIRTLSLKAADRFNSKATVLLVGKSDPLDFSMARWVLWRIDDLKKNLPAAGGACPVVKPAPPIPGAASDVRVLNLQVQIPDKKGVLSPADFTAAVTTDVTIGGIAITAEDRLLLDAVLLGSLDDPQWKSAAAAAAFEPPAASTAAKFRVPSAVADVGDVNPVFTDVRALEAWLDRNRTCDAPAFKTYAQNVQALLASLTASEKGSLPPMALAAQLSAVRGSKPLVLRMAIEQIGGTAVTRSNIWYSLGFPGAATVSAGLLVSYRLSDPISGDTLLTGLIRCAVQPTSFREVRRSIDPTNRAPKPAVTCSFVAG